MSLRAAAALLALVVAINVAWAPAARADERINRFDIAIDVAKNGDVTVTETIAVTSEGNRIRRGIFRDLPRFYESEGDRLRYRYRVLDVRRDGRREPYAVETEGNALRIRIGDADVFLPDGRHEYEIRYRVKNQVRYFDDHDEVYWNATGTYWEFPIDAARAVITLPPGGRITSVAAYTGPFGATGTDYRYRSDGDRHIFETSRPLRAREGLTVALGFEKGLIDPPSAADRGAIWWERNASILILAGSLLALLGYYVRSFDRVGRDPTKEPVFPRYQPPEGYSPAGVHHIFHRGLRGHAALIATLMNLAIKGRLEIDAPDKKSTTLTHKSGGAEDVSEDGQALERMLFTNTGHGVFELKGKYDSAFTRGYTDFRKRVKRLYGSDYFKWNTGYLVIALALSGAAIFAAIALATSWSTWRTLAIVALAGVNGVFAYLMPAPTRKGQDVRTAIEGFKLYMEKAEQLQLNAVEVGSEAPPPMTIERYERFLPYAIALGVEKPWTKHFERLLPEEAAAYHPAWAPLYAGRYSTVHALNDAIVSNISSGVTSALPQSSGSSGSGGGGSSGGGGGGGGGGGW